MPVLSSSKMMQEIIPQWATIFTVITFLAPLAFALVKMYFRIIEHEKKFIQVMEKFERHEKTISQNKEIMLHEFKQVDKSFNYTNKSLVRIETLLELLISNKIKFIPNEENPK